MSVFKAAYINELYKISKRKKIMAASILSILAVVGAAVIVYCLNNMVGIRATGSSEFSLLVLSVLSYTLIPLFTAFVCIDIFSGEFTEQTIRLTLTRPVSRAKVFSAKVLAAASFIMANLLFIMILSTIFSFIINGTSFNLFKIFLSYILEFFPLFVFSLVVILICNITRGTTSAFMLSVLVFILFNGLEIIFPYYKSFFFTSTFDWYRLFLGSYINYYKILRCFLILSGYSIMLFGLGYYLFDKKDM
ncbi:MAG: ABC transporter permease subunit [Clostridiaceae bacterium]|nr:ABC transporter permease subunit [Clostridiaceae bacterium]